MHYTASNGGVLQQWSRVCLLNWADIFTAHGFYSSDSYHTLSPNALHFWFSNERHREKLNIWGCMPDWVTSIYQSHFLLIPWTILYLYFWPVSIYRYSAIRDQHLGQLQPKLTGILLWSSKSFYFLWFTGQFYHIFKIPYSGVSFVL